MEQRGFVRVVSVVFFVAPLLMARVPPACAGSDVTSLHTWSQPQSPLGAGASDSLDENSAAFTAAVLSNGSVRVQVTGSIPWTLGFGAGSGRSLAAGTYEGTIECASCLSSDVRPRLDLVRNSNYCYYGPSGSFHVRRIRHRPDGTLASLWVRFIQDCAYPSGAVSGDLRFHADTSLYLDVPARIAVETGRPVRILASVVDTRGLAVSLQVIERPEGAEVLDQGGGSAALEWGGPVVPGTHRVVWVGTSADGASDTVSTIIDAFRPALFALWGPQEDPVGAGQNLRLTGAEIAPAGGVFSDSTVRLTFAGMGHQLELMLAAPYRAALRPGRYERARRTFVQQLDEAGLHVKVDGRLCDMDSASMHVRRLRRDSAGAVTDLWVTFTQRCVGSTGLLRGEVRVGADTALYIDGPAEVARHPGDAVAFPVQAFDTRGRVVTLAAVELPEGADFTLESPDRGTLSWPSSEPAGNVSRATFVAVSDGASDTLRTTIRTFSRDVLRMTSRSGDYIGLGRTYQLTPKNGQLTWRRSGSAGQVLWVGSQDTWYVDFSAPHDRAPACGVYGGPLPPGAHPGHPTFIEVGTSGRSCGQRYRSFHIRKLALGPGGELKSMWMTFEAGCSQPGGLVGEICIGDPDTTYHLEGPADVYLDSAQPGSFTVTARGSLTADAAWTLVSGPPGATLTTAGASAVVTWPGTSVAGDYRVRLRAAGAAGADTLETWFHVPRPWYVVAQSGPQYFLPQGLDRRLQDRDGTLRCVRNPDNSITVRFTGWEWWFSMDLSRATRERIVPGHYPVTEPSIPPWGNSPNGIYFVWNHLYPTMISGDFTVTEATYSSTDSLLTFRASFRINLSGSSSQFTGEVHLFGDIPTPTLAALVDVGWTGRSIRTRWYVADDGEPRALQRHEGGDWRTIGDVEPRTGLFEHEDERVARGRRYGYRLAHADGSPASEEAWITVPARTEFDVRRVGPNPGVGPLRFAVSTPGGLPLELELLDVAGRVLDRRREASLPEGTHKWTLPDARRLAPGCYFVRLTSGGRRTVRRVILLQ